MTPRVEREDHTPTGIGNKFNIVRAHAAAVGNLPEPGNEWTFADDDIELDKPTRKRLKHRNVIYKTREGNHTKDEPAFWSVDKKSHEQAQRILENPGRLSCCGASGITNDAGTIRCLRCGEPVPDAELDRVFNR